MKWQTIISVLPYTIKGFRIQGVIKEEDALQVYAESTSRQGKCPECGQVSSSVHGHYTRHPQELSCVGCQMRLVLTVKRYRCLNKACPRQTFAESLSSWLQAYARRTNTLTDILFAISVEVGAQVAHRVLKRLQIHVSGDTLLRVLRRKQPDTSTIPLRIIGVDDWAFKRGKTYGTIIVNLETQCVVDLLPDRTAETLATWLQAHPDIELVTRDRSTDYRAGIHQGAPDAIQVADRWHLLLNLRQMLERYLTALYPALQSLPVSEIYQDYLKQQRPTFLRTSAEVVASTQKRQERLAFYEHIQQMRQAGWNIAQLARTLGHHPATIRKYYYATTFPERKPRRTSTSLLDPYLSYLEKRVQEGCENAQQLWREIYQQGYSGSNRQVMKWLQLRRTHAAPSTPHSTPIKKRTPPRKSNLPSSKQLAWLMVKDVGSFSDNDHILLAHLQQHEQFSAVYAYVHRFIDMVKTHVADGLDLWLNDVDNLAVYQLQTFVMGLRQDYDAVHAALAMPWSNGQTEGQVNRLKFIKRQMYGRAKFDLLRLRVLASP